MSYGVEKKVTPKKTGCKLRLTSPVHSTTKQQLETYWRRFVPWIGTTPSEFHGPPFLSSPFRAALCQRPWDKISCNGVRKSKPRKTPRLLDSTTARILATTKKTVQRTESAIRTSQRLIAKSGEMIDSAKKLRQDTGHRVT